MPKLQRLDSTARESRSLWNSPEYRKRARRARLDKSKRFSSGADFAWKSWSSEHRCVRFVTRSTQTSTSGPPAQLSRRFSKRLSHHRVPEDLHILILDRGLFDAVSWLAVMERLARIRSAERQAVEQFLLIDDWRRRITGVVVMTTSPRDSMEREKGFLPVEGAKGSIMNEEVLEQMLETTRTTAQRLKDEFRVFEIDTSTDVSEGPQRTAERVAEIVLGLIEEQLEEEILFLPADAVAELFAGTTCISAGPGTKLLDLFASQGQFKGRETVESDESLVQALPVVIVRNRSGHVLRLKRKEQRSDNPLHEKLVIWAGGHVRREDGSNGASILQCAVRELQEELRLSIDVKDLRFLGAVRSLLAKHDGMWRLCSSGVRAPMMLR